MIARWLSMDPADEFHSPYVYVGNDPINFIDPNRMWEDDITTKIDGMIEVIKTNDNFDRFFLEKSDGGKKFLFQLYKNEYGLVQVPKLAYFEMLDGEEIIKFGWQRYSSDKKCYISGVALAAMIGALSQLGENVSIGNFSFFNGGSLPRSISHLNGNYELVKALDRYGWKEILSQSNNKGYLLPGTIYFRDHKDHFHLQRFRPVVIYKR